MTNTAYRDVAVSVAMAGFVVWLAHQDPPIGVRRSCPQEVELFLRWQHRRREEGLAHREEAYYAYLRDTGAGDQLLDEARMAIARLRQYLLTPA